MMKRVFSILMAVTLLASYISLTIGTHYCGGEVVESKLIYGGTHLSCSMPDMVESCDHSEKPDYNDVRFDKAPCCENEYQTVQVTDEFVQDTAPLSFNIYFVAKLIYTSLSPDLFSKPVRPIYTEYFPPPSDKNIQALFQTFLL
jgi:hypothetical protein